jgi:hypothetical protein
VITEKPSFPLLDTEIFKNGLILAGIIDECIGGAAEGRCSIAAETGRVTDLLRGQERRLLP